MLHTTVRRNHDRREADEDRAPQNRGGASTFTTELAALSRRKRDLIAARRIQNWVRSQWRLKAWGHTAQLLMNYNNQVRRAAASGRL